MVHISKHKIKFREASIECPPYGNRGFMALHSWPCNINLILPFLMVIRN